MSRDYKNSVSAAGNGRGNPMGVGILIGLLLGLCIALGVALYINKGANPFVQKAKPIEAAGRETPATDASKPPSSADKPARTTEAKPRFDFYKILPGTEEAVTDKEFRRTPPASSKEVYFLQVAAFQNPTDADNLKARLALTGIEAQIQTATLPDGKVWHRVRVGPFSNKEELGKSRAALKESNLEANLIKVREPTQ
ncbi:MAG TPA: SPOR domain-containing protein [Burkholderiales bacterium]|jgi:cell division protein FtsN|nr:SPOR domain-containing protein [Burkholderiales bacterium]